MEKKKRKTLSSIALVVSVLVRGDRYSRGRI